MRRPGNSIIGKVTGDDGFCFLSHPPRSEECHEVVQGGGKGSDLNDVKVLGMNNE